MLLTIDIPVPLVPLIPAVTPIPLYRRVSRLSAAWVPFASSETRMSYQFSSRNAFTRVPPPLSLSLSLSPVHHAGPSETRITQISRVKRNPPSSSPSHAERGYTDSYLSARSPPKSDTIDANGTQVLFFFISIRASHLSHLLLHREREREQIRRLATSTSRDADRPDRSSDQRSCHRPVRRRGRRWVDEEKPATCLRDAVVPPGLRPLSAPFVPLHAQASQETRIPRCHSIAPPRTQRRACRGAHLVLARERLTGRRRGTTAVAAIRAGNALTRSLTLDGRRAPGPRFSRRRAAFHGMPSAVPDPAGPAVNLPFALRVPSCDRRCYYRRESPFCFRIFILIHGIATKLGSKLRGLLLLSCRTNDRREARVILRFVLSRAFV